MTKKVEKKQSNSEATLYWIVFISMIVLTGFAYLAQHKIDPVESPVFRNKLEVSIGFFTPFIFLLIASIIKNEVAKGWLRSIGLLAACLWSMYMLGVIPLSLFFMGIS